MDANDVLALGLGISPPGKLVAQRLNTDKRRKELHIELAAEPRRAIVPPRLRQALQAHYFDVFNAPVVGSSAFKRRRCAMIASVPDAPARDAGAGRRPYPIAAPRKSLRCLGGDWPADKLNVRVPVLEFA